MVSEGRQGKGLQENQERLTGNAKGKLVGMVSKKTSEESAFAGTRWAREDQRADPIWARHGRERDGIDI